MAEKYYKISKTTAKRAGLDGRMRAIVDNDYLLLSEKDLKMISLTTEERLGVFGGEEYVPEATTNEAPITDTASNEETEVTNG